MRTTQTSPKYDLTQQQHQEGESSEFRLHKNGLPQNPSWLPQPQAKSFSSLFIMSKPHALIVEVEVPPERMEEFLKAIENNAVGARKEPGCLQFGMLHSSMTI